MIKGLQKLRLWLDVGAFLVLLGLALRFGARTWFWFVGLTLAAICFPLWIIARVQLGSAFTLKPEARRLGDPWAVFQDSASYLSLR